MLIETGNSPGERASKPGKRDPRNRWHAVSVVPGSRACKAAEALKGQRFLSKEAPQLPLPQCDTAECRCKYRHYEDRRGPPRRAESGAPASRTTTDRRRSRGRRETD